MMAMSLVGVVLAMISCKRVGFLREEGGCRDFPRASNYIIHKVADEAISNLNFIIVYQSITHITITAFTSSPYTIVGNVKSNF